MAAVEHTQLHLFKRHYVSDQFGPRLFPRRTTRHKVVFNHPLTERLTGYARRIAHPGQLLDFIQRVGRHGRHNAVNHRRREGHLLRNPVGEIAVNRTRQGTNHIARDMAVLRHIIAGHHAECR